MGGSRSASLAPDTSRSQPQSQGAEIQARNRLRPYLQGQLEFTCGLYAVVNAIRLLREDFAPLTKPDCKRLFAEGTRYLSRKDGLHIAVTWGMDLRRRFALTRHIARQASTEIFTISVERSPFGHHAQLDQVFEWIEASIAAGKPVLVFFSNLPDHYSVVAGITPTALLLFDSIGMRLVKRASCGITTGRWHIAPNGLLRLALEPRA